MMLILFICLKYLIFVNFFTAALCKFYLELSKLDCSISKLTQKVLYKSQSYQRTKMFKRIIRGCVIKILMFRRILPLQSGRRKISTDKKIFNTVMGLLNI